MAQNDVCEFVKECFVWQLSQRVNCDVTPAGLCGRVSYVAQSDPTPQIRCSFNLYAT